jgi:hypothetical protein
MSHGRDARCTGTLSNDEDALSERVYRVHTARQRWTIPGWSALDAGLGVEHVSPIFELLGHRWRLGCYPGGVVHDQPDQVGILLHYAGDCNDGGVSTTFLFRIISALDDGARAYARGHNLAVVGQPTGRLLFARTANAATDTIASRGYNNVVPTASMMDPALGYRRVENDTVTIEVEISVYDDPSADAAADAARRPLMPCGPSTMSADFAALFESAEGSDCAIEVRPTDGPAEAEAFAAHRTVLRARCPALSAMVEHDATEAAPKEAAAREAVATTATIPDDAAGGGAARARGPTAPSGTAVDARIVLRGVQPPVFRQLLRFVYTGECEAEALKEASMATNLLALADRFVLERLKRLCASALARELTTETAAEALMVAHQHRSPELKSIVCTFITENAKDVLASAGFEDLKTRCPKLGMEMVVDLFAHASSLVPPVGRVRTASGPAGK